MKHVSRYFLFLLLAAITGLQSSPDKSIREFWFSGAEINRYELKQPLYGNQYTGSAEFIFVTEPFLPDLQVKRDFGSDPAVDVLKLNATRSFNTGIYTYRTMTSTFHPVKDYEAKATLKTAMSVQDWCGQTYTQVNRRSRDLEVEVRSYFQAKGDQDVALRDVWVEDGLWILARLDPNKLPTGEFRSLPGTVALRLRHYPVDAEPAIGFLRVEGESLVYEVEYPGLGRTLSMTLDRAFPHIIRAWSEKDGEAQTTGRLTHRLMNVSYWDLNKPSDAQKRLDLGLLP